jgi:hypothetical protein
MLLVVWGSGLCGVGRLPVDSSSKGGGFGDSSSDPINNPNLFSVQFATLEGFPDGGQIGSEPAGSSKQTPHRVRLLA